MDHFDKKRESIKMLMDMLKKSASDEVHQGLPKTAPTMDNGGEVDNRLGLREPNNQDGTYHDDTSSDTYKNPQAGGMANGGMSLASDEPENEMPSDLPSTDVTHPNEVPEGPIETEDEENNSSSFAGFLRKKKN